MKVYEYGAQAPRVNADLVAEQMSLAHRYYNTLVELEQRRRAEYDALMAEYDAYGVLAELAAALEEEIEEKRAEIRAVRQRARRPVDTAALNAEVRDLREALGFARALAREAKAVARVQLAVPLEALNAADLARRKAARAVCGVYWGSYLIVEDAMERARKALAPPRFKRWTGDGHLSVQLQGGMSVAEAGSCDDTRFHLRAPAEDTWTTRARRRHAQRTLCRIRIGSTETGAPILAEVPIYMHRPLPADATIKRVHLLRERLADQDRWKVQITVETAEVRRAPMPPSGSVVGIDLGWRVVPEGLRVAYWRDADGCGGQFVSPPEVVSGITKADSLRAIRDRNLDEMKAAVVPAVKTLLAGLNGETSAAAGETADGHPRDLARGHGETEHPLREAAPTLHAWRSPARFVALARNWRESRLLGDDLVFLALSTWAKQDTHLWQWEVHQRDKALRRRREVYRVWAAQVADRYPTLVLEGDAGQKSDAMDLRPLAKLPKAEEGAPVLHDEARHNRVLAAPSILRTCLVQAFQARGRVVLFVPASDTTRRCHVCGDVAPRTDALMQACTCGATWDQDDNAARNLILASGPVLSGSPAPLARGNAAGGRWKRAKDAKAAREAEGGAMGRSQGGAEVAVMAAKG